MDLYQLEVNVARIAGAVEETDDENSISKSLSIIAHELNPCPDIDQGQGHLSQIASAMHSDAFAVGIGESLFRIANALNIIAKKIDPSFDPDA